MVSTMTNLYMIPLQLSLLMKTLNKERINILKLNVGDFLYMFNPSLDKIFTNYFMTNYNTVMTCFEIKNMINRVHILQQFSSCSEKNIKK